MIIQTASGHEILVSDCDYPAISQWAWIVVKKGSVLYAARNEYAGGGRSNRKTRRIYMHKQILENSTGQIDHIDGNGLNNTRENLRAVSHSENQRNRAGAQSNSKSGVRGVYFHKQKNKWAASVRHNKKNISLGLYDTIEAAAAARSAWVKENWSDTDSYRAMIAAAEGNP